MIHPKCTFCSVGWVFDCLIWLEQISLQRDSASEISTLASTLKLGLMGVLCVLEQKLCMKWYKWYKWLIWNVTVCHFWKDNVSHFLAEIIKTRFDADANYLIDVNYFIYDSLPITNKIITSKDRRFNRLTNSFLMTWCICVVIGSEGLVTWHDVRVLDTDWSELFQLCAIMCYVFCYISSRYWSYILLLGARFIISN